MRKIFFNRPMQVLYAIVAMILMPILVPLLALCQSWREIIQCFAMNYSDAWALLVGRMYFKS
jgi:hypothetical protein